MGKYWVAVVCLSGVSKKRRNRLLENNQHSNPKLPVLGITWTSNQVKIQEAMNNNFSSWNGVIGKHAISLQGRPKSFKGKVPALVYKLKLLEQRKKNGHLVFHHDPKDFSVYLVQLHPNVWKVNAFVKQNKGAKRPFKGYLYVGQTSKTPTERFNIHKVKIKGKAHINASKKIVHPHGLELDSKLMKKFTAGPYTLLESLQEEERLATHLKTLGYATYFN